jgi:hypothetical protein
MKSIRNALCPDSAACARDEVTDRTNSIAIPNEEKDP